MRSVRSPENLWSPSRPPKWSPLCGRSCRRPRSRSIVVPTEGRSKAFAADSTSRSATESSSRPAMPPSSGPGYTGFSCGRWAAKNASWPSSPSSIRCGRFIGDGWSRESCGPTSRLPLHRRSSIVSGVASSIRIGFGRSIPICPPSWTLTLKRTWMKFSPGENGRAERANAVMGGSMRQGLRKPRNKLRIA